MPDEITGRLVQLILDEGLKPGDKLPSERQLVARLAVGRSSVREAIKALRAAGVIEVTGGEGMFVGRGEPAVRVNTLSWRLLMSEGTTREVIEAREVVEVALAGFAAERAAEHELEDLRERLNHMAAVQADAEVYVKADLEFHRAVARAAHNRLLQHVFDSLQEVVVAWLTTTINQAEQGKPQSLHEHQAIFDAIVTHDATGARAAMTAHLEAAGNRLLGVVPPGESNGNAEV
jgi:GntR family transcriptional repressor for pyruvate dehydrogenase complex